MAKFESVLFMNDQKYTVYTITACISLSIQVVLYTSQDSNFIQFRNFNIMILMYNKNDLKVNEQSNLNHLMQSFVPRQVSTVK